MGVVHKIEKLSVKERRAQDTCFAQLHIKPRKTKKPIVMAMVGLVGSGKTSVAKEFAKYTGATVIVGDEIRVELRRAGERYEGTRKIAENIAVEIIKHGGNVILDSDHIDQKKRASLREKAKMAGARLVFVRTHMSSEHDGIVGTNFDTALGRALTTHYKGTTDDFFGGATTPWSGSDQEKGAVVKLREMWRRTPHHYTWSAKGGGRWVLKKLPFALFAEVNTATHDWKAKVKEVAKELLK